MTEDKLNALKDLPLPPPRAGAKATALAAAMAAFDEAAENTAGKPQGNGETTSLKHASQPTRRQMMRAPVFYKIAASIAVLAVAVPMTLFFLRDNQGGVTFPNDPNLIVYDRLGGQDDALPSPVDNGMSADSKTRDDKTGGSEAKPDGDLEARIEAALTNQSHDGPAKPELKVPGVNDGKTAEKAPLSKERHDRLAQERAAGDDAAAAPKGVQKLAHQAADQAPHPVNKPSQQAQRREIAEPSPQDARTRKQDEQDGAVSISLPSPAPPPASGMKVAAEAGKPEAPRAPQPVELSILDRDAYAAPDPEEHRDAFEVVAPNPVKQVVAEPVSTFSIDVDTASYSFVRRALNAGQLPPKDAVRVEEIINYFPYNYPRPETAEAPFQPTVTIVPAPWKPTNKLVHIAIKGYDLTARERPRANLVFLIDVSGSMEPADRLPLLKNAFRMLVDELKPEDTVGIVTYASGSGVALVPTKVAQKEKILAAIDRLGAGGSTAGARGIVDAYALALAHFDKAGVNRVILATDGDFNVGISNVDALKGFIERERQSGIFLSVLGVGHGNYNDALMQALAQNGNGTAAYVDTLNEARKVLVDEASSTLFTIAKDVKIQLEFNPAQVSEYRLIGYETRALRREDFNNDKVDAGDIGSGHTVTAIYEVTPVGAPKLVDDLRYRKPAAAQDGKLELIEDPRYRKPDAGAVATPSLDGELGFLKLRYKLPNEDVSKLITVTVNAASEKPEMAAAPEEVRFSVAAAAFGQLLRGVPYLQNYGFDDVLALAQTGRGADLFGYRAEFMNLVRLAKSARP
jgi:Ca-activated chloride channel homolog